MARRVTLWLAQGEETAQRLRSLGVDAARIQVSGNLKYDSADAPVTMMAACVRVRARGTKLIIAGSTLPGEEAMLLRAWSSLRQDGAAATLLLAPRHPQRFAEVERLVRDEFPAASLARASDGDFTRWAGHDGGVILLDTLGDLAGVYSAAEVAFIGGSLTPSGGHNPLEAARFGVPVIMGSSYENFREIVDGMLSAQAIRIVTQEELGPALKHLLQDEAGMGERGKMFYQAQAGATARSVQALLRLIGEPHA